MHRPGGVLRYGIPEFRLPDCVIDAEIEDLVRRRAPEREVLVEEVQEEVLERLGQTPFPGQVVVISAEGEYLRTLSRQGDGPGELRQPTGLVFLADDVLGVWPLHGIIGTWGGIAAGIFGYTGLGGLGGVSFMSQLAGSLFAIVYALVTGFLVYAIIIKVFGFRLGDNEEFRGSDLSIHKIGSYPEDSVS